MENKTKTMTRDEYMKKFDREVDYLVYNEKVSAFEDLDYSDAASLSMSLLASEEDQWGTLMDFADGDELLNMVAHMMIRSELSSTPKEGGNIFDNIFEFIQEEMKDKLIKHYEDIISNAIELKCLNIHDIFGISRNTVCFDFYHRNREAREDQKRFFS